MTKMNIRVMTAIVLLVALICPAIADRPSGQCLFPELPCIQNISKSESPSEFTDPAIGANPPPPPFPPIPPPPVFDENKDWNKAVCRGRRLLEAMTLDEKETAQRLQWPYAQSPWDGDLREALGKWGYSQSEYPCDLEGYNLNTALKALSIDTKAAGDKGSNRCYYVSHSNGPTVKLGPNGQRLPLSEQKYTVDGKDYPETGAFARLAVNAKDGVIYFIHRKSPESTDDKRPKDDLPQIRSSSDLAWGMWNRAAVPDHDIKNIKYFVSVQVINLETAYDLVPRALRTRGLDEVQPWPGTSFQPFKKEGDNKDEEEAALALIGSPNGLAAGYFLLQHKRQLGIKNIWNVVIFGGDGAAEKDVNLMFYVDPNPTPKEEPKGPGGDTENPGNAAQGGFESTVVKRSADGKSFLREHVFRAKL